MSDDTDLTIDSLPLCVICLTMSELLLDWDSLDRDFLLLGLLSVFAPETILALVSVKCIELRFGVLKCEFTVNSSFLSN